MNDGTRTATTPNQARDELRRLAWERARARGDERPRADDWQAVKAARPDLASLAARVGW